MGTPLSVPFMVPYYNLLMTDQKDCYPVSSILIKKMKEGQPWWCSGLALPAAWGVILGTGIESHMGLSAWSLLLPLPVSLPLLCVCLS